MEMVNMHEKQLFMDGKKLVAIISEAGSAGVSLQADRRAVNQKRRVHLTLELPWSADRAIQQFGRTHRSNQASAPEYRLLFTNLGGERRFASIVAKRLESLGALTQGDRRAGPSLSAYNYDSSYGKKALMVMYRGIMEQDNLPVVPPGCSPDKPETIQDFITKAKAALVSVGIVRDTVLGNGKDNVKFSGRIVDSDMHDVGRFLNRLLGLPPDIQNRLFELFISILDVLIQNARIEGNLDSGIVDMKANIIELQGNPKVNFFSHLDLLQRIRFANFCFPTDCSCRSNVRGIDRAIYLHFGSWNHVGVGRRIQEVNVLGGLILPVWGTIEKALSKQARLSHRRLRVVRLETTIDNQRIVGLLVPNAAVETVLQDLAWVQDIED
ncbi:Protein strawberry notch-like protein [Corchorus olitorius]|uniref:Protein strawberry notch-like protein n=1 Tax=Corchorus olitorius TaxID=93759 RepID=A0A1R3I5E4_9ROSI|nr:Protein strawberry notch-like protein [Corchorus olitorius]